MKSKILFFFIFFFLYGMNIGCSEKIGRENNHIIPYVPVYAQIDLGIGGEGNWTHKYLTSYLGKSLGYNGHGILIYAPLGQNEYFCFDATCTNCTSLDVHFTEKDMKNEFVTCPQCKTEFWLRYGDAHNSETEIYPLKAYPIAKNNNRLVISY